MTNTMVPADEVGSPAPAAVGYRWAVPDKPVSIQISFEVVDRLEREVIDSFKAVTKRGSEIGGVLLGHAGPGRQVTIDGYRAVECDYSRGPLYLLSDADKRRLEDAIQEARTAGRSVVGFFRSNTRRDLVLDEEDLALLNEYFGAPENVFLLVKPFAMKPSVAGFFYWEDGKVHSESSRQFPFRRSELVKNFPEAVIDSEALSAVVPSRQEAPRVGTQADVGPIATPPPRQPEPATPATPIQAVQEQPAPAPTVFRRDDAAPRAAGAPMPKPEPALGGREEGLQARDEVRREAAQPKPVTRPVAPEPGPAVAELSAAAARERLAPTPTKLQPEPAGPDRVEASASAKPAPATPPPLTRSKEGSRPVAPGPERKEEPVQPSLVMKPPPARGVPEPIPEPPRAVVAAPERKDKPILQTEIAPPAFTAPAGPGALGRLLSSKWTWIAALVLIAAGGAWFLFQPSQVAEEAPLEDNTLALRVERNAGQLLLSWNRGAPLIQTAQRATLTISDGDHKEDVDLDLGQLRSGSVVYSPMTNDVSFRLEVTDLKRGKSASESVRVLAGRPSPMQQQPLAIPPAAGEAVPEQLEDGGLAAVGDETAEAAQPEAGAPGQPTRTFVAPQVTAAAPRADSLAARLAAPDPSLVASGGVATAPLGLQTQRTLAPPPPAAKPAAQPAVGGRVQEATLLRSVTPLYPPLARQARVSGTVRVEASIGVDGKVKSAKAVSGPPLLRQAAVDAVLRWTYAPATLNGQPVDSNTQVDVGFTLGR